MATATASWTAAGKTLLLVEGNAGVREGTALGVIGESGSGKSTLVRLMLGLDSPTEGTVQFDERPVVGRLFRQVHGLPGQLRRACDESGLYVHLRHLVRRPAGPAVSVLTRAVDVALLPLALATMGVFGLIAHLARGLGH